MKTSIKNVEDLRCLLGQTGGFRGGYVTDVQVSKRRLLDEASAARAGGTTVTVDTHRFARWFASRNHVTGVTDFSMFEQEG